MAMLVGIGFCAPILLAILLTEIPRLQGVLPHHLLPARRDHGPGDAVPVEAPAVRSFQHGRAEPADPSGSTSWPLWLAAAVKLGTLAAALLITAGLAGQARRDYNSHGGRWIAGLAAAAAGGRRRRGAGRACTETGGIAHVASAFISRFDFKPQLFLRDPNLALFWLVIPVIWAGAGPGCLIYLAALKGIPEEQYEAADLDGAGVWQKLVHVMYPNLKALIIINFVGAVIGGFKESGNIFVMTGGGPEDATMTIGLYIWYNAFMFLNFGLSTAMAWIMGALLIGFTLTQLRILNKLQFRNAGVDSAAAEGKREQEKPMPLISQVGRKAWSVRFLIAGMYALLTLGAVTMAYPFLLMIAMATTGLGEYQEFRVVPRYWVSDAALFKKYLLDTVPINRPAWSADRGDAGRRHRRLVREGHTGSWPRDIQEEDLAEVMSMPESRRVAMASDLREFIADICPPEFRIPCALFDRDCDAGASA